MSKAAVNDEIVLLRKTVRQGKVHIIRKLVREIRTLKSKKQPTDGSKKYTEKAERLYEELVIIKKINCDDISKYALATTVDPQQVLSKSDISIKDRALNRLAAHKFIRDKVKSIKEKHNINDNIEKVLEPGKKKLRKLKHIEGKAKKKQQKLENASAEALNAKRQEWLEKQNLNQDATEGVIEGLDKEIVNNKKSVGNRDKSESIGKPFATEINNINERKIECRSKNKIEIEEHDENEIDEDEENEIEEDDESEVEENNKNKIDESEDEEYERGSVENNANEIDERNSSEQSEGDSENERSDSEMEQDNDDDINPIENSTNNTVTTVDDFFLTDSGSHYESTFVPKTNVQVQTHTDGLNRQQRRAQMYGNTIKKKGNKYRNDKPYIKEDKRSIKQEKTKLTPRFYKPFTNSGKMDKPTNISKKKETVEKKEIISETSKTTSLHPSWEAKKKQKPQITAFQGKKIVFDD